MAREVWITGIGLASSLGEGLDAHWQAMAEAETAEAGGRPRFRAALRHPSDGAARSRQADPEARRPAPDGSLAAARHLRRRPRAGRRRHRRQPRHPRPHPRGDRRRRRRPRRRRSTPRSSPGSRARPTRRPFLNEHLSNDLRPTLFLAQLPNLLAGNISIVHKVTGSSRTFMGEEIAGVSAAEVAWRRIRAGQGDIFLVGGASPGRPQGHGAQLRPRRHPVGGRSGLGVGAAGEGRRLDLRLGRRIPGAGGARARRGARPQALRQPHRRRDRPEPAAAGRRRPPSSTAPVRRPSCRRAARRRRCSPAPTGVRHADRRGARRCSTD